MNTTDDGKPHYIVTGVSTGIGREIYRKLSSDNTIKLTGLDSSPHVAGRTTENAQIVNCDLRSHEQVDQFCAEIVDTSTRPTALINNAGIYNGNPYETYSRQLILDSYEVNVFSLLELTARFAAAVKTAGLNSTVVNIASTAGEVGSSDAIYGSSKAAVIGATKSQAMNYKPYLRVNCLSPALVHDTEIEARIPPYRHAAYKQGEYLDTPIRAAAVADLAIAMCGPLFQNITGRVIQVDNGTYPR